PRVAGWRRPRSLAAGAGDGIRTRDIQLGKLTLYRLSYSRTQRSARSRSGSRTLLLPGPAARPSDWWAGLDSNQRRHKPTDLQSVPFNHSGTYPRSALGRRCWPCVEPPIGIEPTTFRLQVGCSTD